MELDYQKPARRRWTWIRLVVVGLGTGGILYSILMFSLSFYFSLFVDHLDHTNFLGWAWVAIAIGLAGITYASVPEKP